MEYTMTFTAEKRGSTWTALTGDEVYSLLTSLRDDFVTGEVINLTAERQEAKQ